MARVHGIHRKRRNNAGQETSEDDKYDGDTGERFELGGCLKSEPNPTVKCARITRELLLRAYFACASRASFCSSPFLDRRSVIHF